MDRDPCSDVKFVYLCNGLWKQQPFVAQYIEGRGGEWSAPLRVFIISYINPLTPNDLQRSRAVSPLKIKIPCKNMREKPTNTTIIHSVYNYV
jgi:hypothetical protein